MRLSFWRTHHDYQDPSCRLLLADHGRRLSRIRQKMKTMPETWQPHSLETRTTSFYTIPMAVRKIGNGHPWPLLPRQRPGKILDSSRRLLYQMDRGQTTSHNYSPASPTIFFEGYYMPIWCPTYNHHRKWPIVYRQRTC